MKKNINLGIELAILYTPNDTQIAEWPCCETHTSFHFILFQAAFLRNLGKNVA